MSKKKIIILIITIVVILAIASTAFYVFCKPVTIRRLSRQMGLDKDVVASNLNYEFYYGLNNESPNMYWFRGKKCRLNIAVDRSEKVDAISLIIDPVENDIDSQFKLALSLHKQLTRLYGEPVDEGTLHADRFYEPCAVSIVDYDNYYDYRAAYKDTSSYRELFESEDYYISVNIIDYIQNIKKTPIERLPINVHFIDKETYNDNFRR